MHTFVGYSAEIVIILYSRGRGEGGGGRLACGHYQFRVVGPSTRFLSTYCLGRSGQVGNGRKLLRNKLCVRTAAANNLKYQNNPGKVMAWATWFRYPSIASNKIGHFW